VKKTRQNLKPFAGVGVAHCGCEEAEAEGQHDDIQHEVLLVVLVFVLDYFVFRERRIATDQQGSEAQPRVLPVSVAVKCHPAHMFSRRA
jgi:hypothetical protein